MWLDLTHLSLYSSAPRDLTWPIYRFIPVLLETWLDVIIVVFSAHRDLTWPIYRFIAGLDLSIVMLQHSTWLDPIIVLFQHTLRELTWPDLFIVLLQDSTWPDLTYLSFYCRTPRGLYWPIYRFIAGLHVACTDLFIVLLQDSTWSDLT